MKENSIEEDIRNAEHFINSIKTDKEYEEENGWHGYYNKEIVELVRMLEHILSDYKRVLKENEEWQRAYQEEKDKQFDFINKISLNDSIPVQKVKDKIEELQKGPLKINENNKYYYETEAYNKIIIQVLQELLEGRK